MRTKENKTRVIFRVFSNGEVIALFPHIDEGNGNILSYMHIGQHGGASPLIVNDTTPATPGQYKELFAELQGIGYNLEVGHKVTKCPMSYKDKKAAVRDEAIEFSNDCGELGLSWWDVAHISDHFETLGRRYGLLREFRENGII